MLTKLKKYLLQNGVTQRQLANKSGLNECEISLIVAGRLRANDRQRRAILRTLGKKNEKIFEE